MATEERLGSQILFGGFKHLQKSEGDSENSITQEQLHKGIIYSSALALVTYH